MNIAQNVSDAIEEFIRIGYFKIAKALSTHVWVINEDSHWTKVDDGHMDLICSKCDNGIYLRMDVKQTSWGSVPENEWSPNWLLTCDEHIIKGLIE